MFGIPIAGSSPAPANVRREHEKYLRLIRYLMVWSGRLRHTFKKLSPCYFKNKVRR
jgi:hypothetical protein